MSVDVLDGTHALITGHTPIILIGFTTAALELYMFIKLRQFAQIATPST
jgi:hypothetical protein